MAIGTPSFTRSAIDSPTADFAKTLSAFGTNMLAQAKQDEDLKLQRERQAAQDARQAITNRQNDEMFKYKTDEIVQNQADKARTEYTQGVLSQALMQKD